MSTQNLQADAVSAERCGAADALDRARLAHLAEQGRMAALLHAIAAIPLLMALFELASGPTIGAWISALVVVLGLRIAATHYVRAATAQPRRQIALLCGLTIATGLVWGVTPWLFLPGSGTTAQFVVLLLVVGIAGAGIPFLGCAWYAYIGFVGVVLGPSCAWLFTLGDPNKAVLGGLMFIYAAALLLAAQNYARNFKRSHELTAELARANAETERANEQLRAQMEESLRAQDALARSERRFHTAFDHAPIGMALVTKDGLIFHANPTLAELLGRSSGGLDGTNLTDFLMAEDEPGFQSAVAPLCRGEATAAHSEVRFRTEGGATLWASVAVGILDDTDETAPYFIVEIQDITESIELSARLQYEADHDPLTGLFNRRAFVRRLELLAPRAGRREQHHAVAYLELERFKLINDVQGHMAGDEVLRQVAGVLQQQIGPQDTLARLRGDEFAILFEECDTATAYVRAQSMVRAVAEFRFFWRDQVFRLDLSAGVVALDADIGGVDDILRAADTACSAAKEAGGARVHTYRPDDSEMQRIQGQLTWVNYITDALDQGRFELWGQPIVPTRTTAGSPGLRFEILVRMRDPRTGEPFTPGSFMEAAERYGLATRLDRWVLDAVFRWFRDNPWAIRHVDSCAINLSGMSLDDPEFTRAFIRDMRDAPLAPPQLRFEITETAAIGHLAQARKFMERVESLGCGFALDDFGSGLSSFGYLRALPVDALKIDGQFIRDIVDDQVDRALVRSIHEVGRTLGLETIAEFVENASTYDVLQRIGVDHVQGHYLGVARPLAALFEQAHLPEVHYNP